MFWIAFKYAIPIMAAYLFYRIQLYVIYPSFIPEGSRDKDKLWKPSDFNLNGRLIYITSLDKTKISAYHLYGQEPIVVIWMHGNAGNMGHRLPLISDIQKLVPVHFLIFDYRGYGISEGSASESGLKLDAEAVYLFAKEKFKNYKIVIAGQSLGGAAAIHVASKFKSIDALIIENTFTSMPDVVPYILPRLAPFKYLCVQSWNSLNVVKQLPPIPTLFMSSGKDEIIPPLHMKMLYEKLSGAQLEDPKNGVFDGSKWHKSGKTILNSNVWFHYFPMGTHNELSFQPNFYQSWSDFFKVHLMK
eukprot:NODE_19_length_47148_cov_1.447810.p20 type:complete len:302 gc:universal NODE_19_length_47148_cov_1.447810:13913-13008(-)